MNPISVKSITEAAKAKATSAIEPKDLRTFLNESDSETLQGLTKYPETLLYILKNKALNTKVFDLFLSESPTLLADGLKETGFVVDKESALKLIKLISDDLASVLIKSWKSIPFEIPEVMGLINETPPKINTAAEICEARGIRTPQIVLQLARNGVETDFIVESVSVPEIATELLKSLNEDSAQRVSNKIFTSIVVSADGDECGEIQQDLVDKFELTNEAYLQILNCAANQRSESLKALVLPYREIAEDFSVGHETVQRARRGSKREIIKDHSTVFFTNCPKTSRHYKSSINHNADAATLEDLPLLRDPSDICKVLEKVKLSELTEESVACLKNLTPSQFNIAIPFDRPEVLHKLFNFVPSPHRQIIRESLPSDNQPAEINSKKKSYFSEAFIAISKGDVDEFLTFVNKQPYSIEKFASDSHQDSKKRSCEIKTITKLVLKLSKQDTLAMCLSTFSFDLEKAKHTFTASEVLLIERNGKGNFADLFELCAEKLELLGKLKKEDFESVLRYNTKAILADTKMLKLTLKKVEERFIEIDDLITKFVDLLPAKVLHGAISCHYNVFNTKGSDDKYVFSVKEILEYISQADLRSSFEEIFASLEKRETALALELAEAYLGAGKGLSAFFTKHLKKDIKVKVVRKKEDALFIERIVGMRDGSLDANDLFTQMVDEGYSVESLVNQFGRSSKELLSKNKHLTFKSDFDGLKHFSNGHKVEVQSKSWNNSLWKEVKAVTSAIDNGVQITIPEWNIRLSHWEEEDGCKASDLQLLAKAIAGCTIVNIDFDGDVLAGLVLAGLTPLAPHYESLRESAAKFNTEQMDQLNNAGFLFTDDDLSHLITHGSKDVLEWLIKHVPSCLDLVFKESDFGYYSSVDRDEVMKLGFEVLTDEDYAVEQAIEEIDSSPTKFDSIDMTTFSRENRSKVIKHAMLKDPRMSKLGLLNTDISRLDVLQNYDGMSDVVGLDDETLAKLLNLESSFKTNKKIMKGLAAFVSLNPTFPIKFKLVQSAVFSLTGNNEQSIMRISDALDYSAQSEVIETSEFSDVRFKDAELLLKHASQIKGKLLIGIKKSEVLKLLRDSASESESYFQDIVSMNESITNGAADMKARIPLVDVERGEQIQIMLDKIESRMSEISGIYEAEHLHDRLVVLSKFLEVDGSKPLKQDKYSPLENSKSVYKELGYSLFFPKTKADLIEMGGLHGWCVNTSTSYENGVINNGDVLVGIGPESMEATVPNLRVLVYFKNGNEGLYLSQMRWSTHVKGSQEDATDDFDHKKINSIISKHLMTIRSKSEAA